MNNITLLRLFFSLQVFYIHSCHFLHIKALDYLSSYPGVPAFFFVCGYLIYGSAKRHSLHKYVKNRFLRIYPALFVVTLSTVIFLLLPLSDLKNLHEAIVWTISNLTIFQQYNPPFFREYGVGAINGALWTLSIEIIVYFIIFIVVCSKYTDNFYFLFISMCISFLIYSVISKNLFNSKDIFEYWKYVKLSPVYWWWMFAIGVMFRKYDQHINNFKWIIILLAFLYIILTLDLDTNYQINVNEQSFIVFLSYACLIYSLAFFTPKIFRLPDISYGIYIWHMPVINLFLPNFAK